MSSYLHFYLVPKAKKTKYLGDISEEVKLMQEPLLFMCYSRGTEVYQAYDDTLSPVYAGNGDRYTELDAEKANQVVREFEKDVNNTEKRLSVTYKMLKEGGYHEELWSEIQEMEKYLDEQKETLEELKFIAMWVYECTGSWTNFEKVLINIG